MVILRLRNVCAWRTPDKKAREVCLGPVREDLYEVHNSRHINHIIRT
jgi:hypothetical protein